MTLSILFQYALAALQRRFPAQQDANDAYLASSVDIYDLERRMRALDQRGGDQPLHLYHSA